MLSNSQTAGSALGSGCPCASGLRADRCCTLDWSRPDGAPPTSTALGHARSVLEGGNLIEAEGVLVECLERAPRNVQALRLLCELRRVQDLTSAVEALLVRIVRIDPNDLAATQSLALLLFSKGALAQAEHHARNTVRIAPTDVQSHI